MKSHDARLKKRNIEISNKIVFNLQKYQCQICTQTTIHLDNQPAKKYIGLCEPTFKKRYAGNKSSLMNHKYKHDTTLSTKFWRLKELIKNPHVTWRVIESSKAFTPESNKCHLCLAEKYQVGSSK